MYGTVVASPAGSYVIPTVKVINVPAVTQANGQLACTTISTWSLQCPDQTSAYVVSDIFTGMNDGMQAYFSGQQGPTIQTYGSK